MDRNPKRKVIALLAERGIKHKDVAAAARLSVPAISGALNGHWESRPVQIACAKILGMDQKRFDKLWHNRRRSDR